MNSLATTVIVCVLILVGVIGCTPQSYMGWVQYDRSNTTRNTICTNKE